MHVEDVILAPGVGGFFNDDQPAIRHGAVRSGEWYDGIPVTGGFSRIREPAECLSIGLVLEDGYVAWGDMMSVQYAGAGGRDAVFRSDRAAAYVMRNLKDKLLDVNVGRFRDAVSAVFIGDDGETDTHAGIQYGVSQALLRAAAHLSRCTVTQQVCTEYGIPIVARRVPVYGQSGDLNKSNVDKMIMKRVDVLPHGLINNMEKFGHDGEAFLDYLHWVVRRIAAIGSADYRPVLYFDLYGMPGFAFGDDLGRVTDYLCRAAAAAKPHRLRIESPVLRDSVDAQIAAFAELRSQLRNRSPGVEIAVDEWCNTVEDIERFVAAGAADLIQIKMPDLGSVEKSIAAVLLCRESGVDAFLGGSCTETDMSARLSAHIAVATQPAMMLAKPGMGFDEGFMIVGNEQSRILAELSRLTRA